MVQVLTSWEVSGKYGAMLGSTTPRLLKHCKTFSLVPKIFETKSVHHHPTLPQISGMKDENNLNCWEGLMFQICFGPVEDMERDSYVSLH